VAARGELKGLLDLCDAMPSLGDGTCYIQVTRVKPIQAFNQNCAGPQTPIWSPIDDAEFALKYGGAEYTLRGYNLKDDGKSKAATDPVAYRASGPVNLDSALSEDDVMQRQPSHGHAPNGQPQFRRPIISTPQAATAEADMHARDLEHRETMDEREERRAKEREQRKLDVERNRSTEQTNMTRILAESKDREAERLAQAYERQLEAANAKGGGLADMAELLKVIKPGDDTAALSRQHAQEIKQLGESHKGEIIRQSEQTQRAMEMHTESIKRVEDQARHERERSENLIREAERRANEMIRETERRSDQRVSDAQNLALSNYNELKSRSEERLRDTENQWQRRFDDLKENHARELRGKESEIALMRSNLEGNQSVILAGKDAEIKRLQHELRMSRDEAEKNKDWVGKMKEMEAQAEALGYSKPDPSEGAPEEDMKTFALKTLIGLGGKLPELIKSGSDALAQVRNPGVPPDVARSQARGGMVRGSMHTAPRLMHRPNPVQLQPLAFATEDTDYTPPPGAEAAAMAVFQAQAPMGIPSPPPPPVYEQQHLPHIQPPPQQPEAQAPALPAPAAAPTEAPAAAAAMHPAAPPSETMAPAPASAPAAEDPNDPLIAQAISAWGPQFAQAFESGVAPDQVAAGILGSNDRAQLRMALDGITIERVLAIMQRNPGEHGSLTTRNGQKFLRSMWSALEKGLAG
jgi:hypothetical protein